MITFILSNYVFAMTFSKFISITGIIVQLVSTVLSFAIFKEGFPKTKRVLKIFAIVLLLIDCYALFSGRFSEQVINEFEGMVYFGQIENGEANGWGRLFDEQRNIEYIGCFQNNKYEGKGCLYSYENKDENWAISSKYDGEFKGGKYCGYGKSYFYDNSKEFLVYDGEYRDGLSEQTP